MKWNPNCFSCSSLQSLRDELLFHIQFKSKKEATSWSFARQFTHRFSKSKVSSLLEWGLALLPRPLPLSDKRLPLPLVPLPLTGASASLSITILYGQKEGGLSDRMTFVNATTPTTTTTTTTTSLQHSQPFCSIIFFVFGFEDFSGDSFEMLISQFLLICHFSLDMAHSPDHLRTKQV